MQEAKARKLVVGIIGCGLISQIMHIPNLRDLREKFHIHALCDLSEEVVEQVADDHQIEIRSTNYLDLLNCAEIEAVLILTSGDHAPLILDALEHGKHVFVEKPLCFCLHDADRLIERSQQLRLCLMVGYMKWFDPAYQEAKRLLRAGGSPQFAQVTTIFTPEEFYFRHHRLQRYALPSDTLERLQRERQKTLAKELPDLPEHMREVYIDMLLDSAIHDIYVLRGLLGDPQKISYCSYWSRGQAFHLSWQYQQDFQVHYSCVQTGTPGSRYLETLAYYGPQQRLFLDFPSPYLRNVPTELTLEEVVDGRAVRSQFQGSFEGAFKRELEHFYSCVTTGTLPLTSALEGRKDIVLMQEAIRIAVHEKS